MILLTIKGKRVSEDTAALALEEYFRNHPHPAYIFKAADVVRCGRQLRIIVEKSGNIFSIDYHGCVCAEGQKDFEHHGYEKVGRLHEFLLKELIE